MNCVRSAASHSGGRRPISGSAAPGDLGLLDVHADRFEPGGTVESHMSSSKPRKRPASRARITLRPSDAQGGADQEALERPRNSISPGLRSGSPEMSLMTQAKRGDRQAYASLFAKYAGLVHQTASIMSRPGTSAEDVVQETFTKGLSSIRSYRGMGKPRSWFVAIATNICRHQHRDFKKEPYRVPEYVLSRGRTLRNVAVQGTVVKAMQYEESRKIMVALDSLTRLQRAVISLHYYEDQSFREIGALLRMRTGTVRALAFRARLMLRKCVTGAPLHVAGRCHPVLDRRLELGRRTARMAQIGKPFQRDGLLARTPSTDLSGASLRGSLAGRNHGYRGEQGYDPGHFNHLGGEQCHPEGRGQELRGWSRIVLSTPKGGG